MTSHPHSQGPSDSLGDPELDPALKDVAATMARERPLPSAGFRAMLRRRLIELGADSGERIQRPARLRTLIAAYGGSGLVLLAVAALGLAGLGPLRY